MKKNLQSGKSPPAALNLMNVDTIPNSTFSNSNGNSMLNCANVMLF